MLQEWSKQGETECKEKLKSTIEKIMTTANRITDQKWSGEKTSCEPAGSEELKREEEARPLVLRNIPLGMPKNLSKFQQQVHEFDWECTECQDLIWLGR